MTRECFHLWILHCAASLCAVAFSRVGNRRDAFHGIYGHLQPILLKSHANKAIKNRREVAVFSVRASRERGDTPVFSASVLHVLVALH